MLQHPSKEEAVPAAAQRSPAGARPVDEPVDQPVDQPVDPGPVSSAIIRLARAHRALATQLMREVGLRPDQGALMMHLWSVGPVRQTALAAHFGRDSAATTRTVQRLERSGHLRRRTDPSDRRATLVEPTPAGNALRGRVEQIWEQLERVITDDLGPEDSRQALDLLDRLADLVDGQLTAAPPSSLDDV